MSARYLDHFGISQAPFGNSPDPALFCNSRGHQGALDWIEGQIAARAPLLALTGEEGSGKTTLLRRVLDRNGGRWVGGLVSARQPGGILGQARDAFVLPDHGDDPAQLARQLRRFAELTRGRGGYTVLMVDDAQALGPESLAALVTLTENGGKGALTLLLAGQPDLLALLDPAGLRDPGADADADPAPESAPESAGFVHAVLPPLATAAETAAYVEQRLSQAGADGPIFDVGAMQVLHSFGLGLPRLINVMADYCLATAAAEGVKRLDGAWVSAVLHEADSAGLLTQLAEQAADPSQPASPVVAPVVPPLASVRRRAEADRDRNPPATGADEAPSPYLLTGPSVVPPPRRGGLGLGLWLSALVVVGGAGFLWVQLLPQQDRPPVLPATTILPADPPAMPAGQTAALSTALPPPRPAATPAPADPAPAAAEPPAAPTVPADPATPAEPAAAPLPPVPVSPDPATAGLMQRALDIEVQDPAAAALAYARAALRGRERAAYYLGQLHETATPAEPGLARLWYAAAPGLAAAQRRLRALGAGDLPPGTPAAPVPLFQARLEGGGSEMIWRVPGAVPPAQFRVEMTGPDGQPLPARITPVPGLIAPFPVGAWRVTSIAADGAESPPSALVEMIPEGQGATPATR